MRGSFKKWFMAWRNRRRVKKLSIRAHRLAESIDRLSAEEEERDRLANVGRIESQIRREGRA